MRYTYKYAAGMFPTWLTLVKGREAKDGSDVGGYRLGTSALSGGIQIERIVNDGGGIHTLFSRMTPKEFAYFVWALESSLEEIERNKVGVTTAS